ncbi:hypothetical protein Misp01_07850 [Microtetraspora sp. NBRC 13810]|uniref:hypothetical protein n=1 Tax=Microtetraspora sp. NBRC 13810 TaxID=3030990 RepID=UPI0024A2430F|nr:hypothetical protein [Microtetraspora sp. NBRC 13810]GLW05655.1 hypothetical protein Misp01_07850 [Microtetraspora sp. NBRC 13810]
MNSEELRLLIREVLREVVDGRAVDALPAAEPVTIRDDGDLNAFALRVLDLAADPGRAADLRAGRLRFRLDAAAPAVPEPGRADGLVHRHEKGAVTERHVAAAAAAGARLVLGRGAVLTPLAREKARNCGLVVERES